MSDTACWQCGAPAHADCAYRLSLFADSGRGLDAFGLPVSRGPRRDKVTVSVPRCAACRSRNRLGIAITLGGAIVGAIIFPIVQSRFWPQMAAPFWLSVSHIGIGTPAAGIGAVIGFLIALLAVAGQRRFVGRRSLNLYPPVVALRQEGWHFPE